MKLCSNTGRVPAAALALGCLLIPSQATADPRDEQSAAAIMATMDARAPSEAIHDADSELVFTEDEARESDHVDHGSIDVGNDDLVIEPVSDDDVVGGSSSNTAFESVSDSSSVSTQEVSCANAISAAVAAVGGSALTALQRTPTRVFDVSFDLDDDASAFRTLE